MSSSAAEKSPNQVRRVAGGMPFCARKLRFSTSLVGNASVSTATSGSTPTPVPVKPGSRSSLFAPPARCCTSNWVVEKPVPTWRMLMSTRVSDRLPAFTLPATVGFGASAGYRLLSPGIRMGQVVTVAKGGRNGYL